LPSIAARRFDASANPPTRKASKANGYPLADATGMRSMISTCRCGARDPPLLPTCARTE